MDSRTFNEFRRLVYDQSGIALRPGKEAMVRARLAKRMRALGMQDHRAYLRLVRNDSTGDELTELLNAVSTNVTTFMREPDHFGILGEAMGGWLESGQKRFRFWSAACSSGEEPYSMAIALLEAAQLHEVDMKVLATDISTKVLAIARAGVYGPERMGPLPRHLRHRYFVRHGRGEDATWEVGERLRSVVVIKRMNLMRASLPLRGPLDAVFCRNVMIYFDAAGRQRLVDEIYRVSRPGGYLFLGHAESLTGLQSGFRPLRASVYVKP